VRQIINGRLIKEPMFLARKIILPIILISISGGCGYAGPDYEMETLAEFSPDEDNDLSRLGIGYPNPFSSKPANLVEPHRNGMFKVDNKGRIYRWSYIKSRITIQDFSSDRIDSLIPTLSENEALNYIWLGPRDEIYAVISEYPDRNRKLYRYFNFDGDYTQDENFATPEPFDKPRVVNVSSDGKLFFGIQYIGNYGRAEFDVYGPDGDFIKRSFSPCETADGSEFYFKKSDVLAQENRTSINIKKGNELILGTSYVLSLKCTLNNLIIIIVGDYKRISLDDEKKLAVDKPCAHIVDLKKRQHITIDPYYECADPDYPFHTVSNVESNYKGEIFATVIYFNTPGKVAGDEKIVLYRWKNIVK
jgi:hypothetical protein